MSTTSVSPVPSNPATRIQRTVVSLETLEPVTVVKAFDFDGSTIKTVDDAYAAFGNDATKILNVLKKGLEYEARNKAGETKDGWFVIEDGEIKGPLSGDTADKDKLNALVLTLAKTAFGYSGAQSAEEKAKAKEAAANFVKTTPALLNGIKAVGVAAPSSEE